MPNTRNNHCTLWGAKDTIMRNKTTISIPASNPARVKRGHSAYRGGAGVHADRRTHRLRTRSDKKRFAVQEQS